MNSPASEFDHDAYGSTLFDLAAKCRDDAAFRRRLEADPRAALAERPDLIELPESMEVQISHNTEDTMYLVLPPNPNTALADTAVANVTGGSSVGTAGTAGSGGTLSCPSVCFSSVACAGTASSHQP